MPTNKQREAERRRLQRQLEERRKKQAARQRFTLIASIVGTLVLIVAVVVVIVAVNSGNDSKTPAAAKSSTATATASSATSSAAASSTTAAPVPVPTTACTGATGRSTVSFQGLTVTNATNLKVSPKVVSKSTAKPTTLQCADLVVGTGAAAKPTSTVAVQYYGVLYTNGTLFDASWTSNKGKPVSFPLTQVVPGFTQGIGGAGKVAPMRVGGRRVIIVPSALGYGAQANGKIPANSVLVFVIDLTKVS